MIGENLDGCLKLNDVLKWSSLKIGALRLSPASYETAMMQTSADGTSPYVRHVLGILRTRDFRNLGSLHDVILSLVSYGRELGPEPDIVLSIHTPRTTLWCAIITIQDLIALRTSCKTSKA